MSDVAASDAAEVERIVRAAGTSFYRGMAVLPKPRRVAMYAIYAFCRVVDDIVDEPGEDSARRAALAQWRERIGGLYEGRAEDAVSRVLLRAVRDYALRREDFLAVIDGMEMDGERAIVAPSLADLDLYCDRVAAAVGRLSVRAFGDGSAAADEVAYHLGRALQLTNILRDVAEDAARGRVYLPAEFFEGAAPATAEEALGRAELGGVCERVAGMAGDHFAAARAAMGRCDRRAMRPARLMAATYAAILRRLRRRGWARLNDNVTLSRLEKLLILLRYGL